MQYHILSSVHIDHIRAVARELGPDWYYHHISSHARCGKLRSREDRHIWINFMVAQGRFQLNAGLDPDFYAYGEQEQISVALGRRPAAVAADIRRRLLPGAGPVLSQQPMHGGPKPWPEMSGTAGYRTCYAGFATRFTAVLTREISLRFRLLPALVLLLMNPATAAVDTISHSTILPWRMSCASLQSTVRDNKEKQMKHPDSVYYTEGVSGQRKFTFEVFREADGSYRAVAARWNARLNKVDEQTQFTAPDKAGLREQPYPSTRQVKIFLTLNSGTTAMYDVITEVPTSEQMTEVRERTGLTQTELGKIIGINLRNYQLRETGDRSTNPGEYNLLMLLADNHPLYRIKGYTPEKDAAGIAEKLLLAEPDAAEVRRLRIAMGLKQKEVAERFGYTLGAWRSKEMASKRGTLRQAEYNFMLLLLDEHPTLKLTARKASQAN